MCGNNGCDKFCYTYKHWDIIQMSIVKSVKTLFECTHLKVWQNLQKMFKNKSVETFDTHISVALL